VVLGDHLRRGLRGVAGFDQLEQLEAAGAARRPDHLAGGHCADGGGERAGDFIQAAPAQVAAFQCVVAVGIAHGRGGEFHLALVDQRFDAVDLLLRGGDLVGGGVFRNRNEDVGQVELRAAVGLRGEGGIDLGVADADPGLRKTLAQALDGELVAQRIAEIGERLPGLRQLRTHLVERELVLPRDVGDRGVEFLVAHAQPGVGSARHFQPHQDQALEHLPAQDVRGRQLVLASGVLRADVLLGAVQFALQDDVVIDHGDDAVQRLDLRTCGRRGAGKQQGEGKQAGERFVHGVSSGELTSSPLPSKSVGGAR
jgi:hypothetical protein